MSKLPSNRYLGKLFSEAFQWLFRRRKKHPPSSDIWDFRRGWEDNRESIADMFRKGAYQFDIQKKITLSRGERVAVWSSRDALVLKVLTWIIQEILKPVLSISCYHLEGHGGVKGAVRDVMAQCPKYMTIGH